MNNVNVGEEIKKYIEDCKSNIKYYDIKNNTFYNAEKIIKDDGKIEKSTKNFNDFYRYLEEIVAYMKYYGFDDK